MIENRVSAHIVVMFAVSALVGSCSTYDRAHPQSPTVEQSRVAAPASSSELSHVVDLMDQSVDPCTNFFEYACGGWIEANSIPADQSRWGRFQQLRERNNHVLRVLLESGASSLPDFSKAATFYTSCMDEEAVEATNTDPLRPQLDAIAAVKGAKDVARVLGELHRAGAHPFFHLYASADFKDPNLEIAYLSQGGLGLPDRDYYLQENDRFSAIRDAYADHVATVLTLAGEPAERANRHAAMILRFETQLARVSMSREDLREPENEYNRIDRSGLSKVVPQLPWKDYFAALGHPQLEGLSVAPPTFFAEMGKLIAGTKPEVLQTYLRWHALHEAAPLLSSPFVAADFAFYGKLLHGKQQLPERWKVCVERTDAALGEILGRAFVDREFSSKSKDVASTMIRGIESAFEATLPKLAWMDAETQKRAIEKVEAIVNKIGYPETWRDYDGLEPDAEAFFANVIEANAFETDYELEQVGKPVDRKRWHMTPPTVNAYYNPSFNEMVFPAGIMQPPFFDESYPMAMNFGGIGMVMGHELTHGFDDQGRKFDGSGRFVEWWAPEVAAKFEEQAVCVEQLYSGYEVQPGLTLNGKLTLGENIADLGGIKAAHAAYRQWAQTIREPQAIDGLTNEQLFFVSFAQIWCSEETAEAERVLVLTDPHSRPEFRVNGPLANFQAFARAFSCEPGTPMRPHNTCEVW